MTLEKKEARAEKDEAEKYQKFQQELVRHTVIRYTLIYMYNHVYIYIHVICAINRGNR